MDNTKNPVAVSGDPALRPKAEKWHLCYSLGFPFPASAKTPRRGHLPDVSTSPTIPLLRSQILLVLNTRQRSLNYWYIKHLAA